MKAEDNPLFKISSLLSLQCYPRHKATLKKHLHVLPSENNKDVTTEMLAGLWWQGWVARQAGATSVNHRRDGQKEQGTAP